MHEVPRRQKVGLRSS